MATRGVQHGAARTPCWRRPTLWRWGWRCSESHMLKDRERGREAGGARAPFPRTENAEVRPAL
eukprot:3182420-Pyramimonas_sp.AAC.1